MALLDWIDGCDRSRGRRRGRAAAPAARRRLRRPGPTCGEHSRDYLQPWEPTWPADDLTRAAFRRRLARLCARDGAGHAWPFFVFDAQRPDPGRAPSPCRTSAAASPRRGRWATGSASPSPGAARPRRPCGPWRASPSDDLRLHRLEAACVPTNARVAPGAGKGGLREGGRGAGLILKINGAWADHLLFGLVCGADVAG